MDYRDYVYVIDKNNNPCNPISNGFARKLLNSKSAEIINHDPFVIKRTDEYFREDEQNNKYVLKIDMGYKHIGFSVTNDSYEVFAGNVDLLEGMSDRLLARRGYRSTRRSRIRHRRNKNVERNVINNPNYTNGNEEGWIPPSIQHKIDSHERLVDKIASWIPIDHIELEVASFDIQQMKADLEGIELSGVDYQNGEMKGYDNVKLYVKERDKYTCQICHKKVDNLEIHHIKPRSQGGSNRPGNLITLCKCCHQKVHKNNNNNELFKQLQKKRISDDYKDSTFMNTVRWNIYNTIGKKFDVDARYGYVTNRNRNAAGLRKFHFNDAVCIGSFNNISLAKSIYVVEQRRCNDRKMVAFFDAKYIDSRDGKKKKGNELCKTRKPGASKRSTRKEDIENDRIYRQEKVSKGELRPMCHSYCLKNGDLVYLKDKNTIVEISTAQKVDKKIGYSVKILYKNNDPNSNTKTPSISISSEEYEILRTTGECDRVKIVRTRRGMIWKRYDRLEYENKYGDQYHVS